MAFRLACKRFVTQQQPRLSSVIVANSNHWMAVRSFAAPAAVEGTGEAPSVFDKIISLTIVDPSGARRKINGLVGEFFFWQGRMKS
jgi:hypothetical protein